MNNEPRDAIEYDDPHDGMACAWCHMPITLEQGAVRPPGEAWVHRACPGMDFPRWP
jgi:hypothetical protein